MTLRVSFTFTLLHFHNAAAVAVFGSTLCMMVHQPRRAFWAAAWQSLRQRAAAAALGSVRPLSSFADIRCLVRTSYMQEGSRPFKAQSGVSLLPRTQARRARRVHPPRLHTVGEFRLLVVQK